MAMGYLLIAYVCMIMAVQHCLQFCTSFQSQMKKMLIGGVEADAIFFMVFLWSLSFLDSLWDSLACCWAIACIGVPDQSLDLGFAIVAGILVTESMASSLFCTGLLFWPQAVLFQESCELICFPTSSCGFCIIWILLARETTNWLVTCRISSTFPTRVWSVAVFAKVGKARTRAWAASALRPVFEAFVCFGKKPWKIHTYYACHV